jgi:endonuclease YncB( thermonuclease family)
MIPLLLLLSLCPCPVKRDAHSSCLRLTFAPGSVARVIDGDTWDQWNVGLSATERVRLLGVDAYELRDSLGPAARAYTMDWLNQGAYTVDGCKRDSFGRLLLAVTRGTDTLATDLIAAHLGVPYGATK